MHYAEDSLPNIEELEGTADDNASTSSVVHTPQYRVTKRKPSSVLFAAEV
jgi:hypothetical protein